MDIILGLIVTAFIVSAVLTVIAIPQIIKLAYAKHLFDVPSYRKVHKGMVPRLGGTAFLPAIMIAALMVFGVSVEFDILPAMSIESAELMYAAAGTLFLYMGGLMDDLMGLSYKVKFPIQIISALLICASGLWIDNFHGVLGIYQVHPLVGVPFSVVLIVLIINSINLIDGIDGLASGLCITGIAVFSLLFFNADYFRYAIIGAASLGALIPFYIYNVYGHSETRTKIFMGDAGSLSMGYIISVFAMKTATIKTANLPADNDPYYFVFAFAILITPVFDVARVFLHRIVRKRNPFSSDQCHIHHKFLAMGFSIGATRHIIMLISVLFLIMNIIMVEFWKVNVNWIILSDVLLWTLMHMAISWKIRSMRKHHVASAEKFCD